MKNLDKYLALLNDEVDGLLLTSRYSRHYGAEFDIAEGVAIVSKAGCRYFTDSRYIESAEQEVSGAEVSMPTGGMNYRKLARAIVDELGIKTMGFEDEYMSVSLYNMWTEALPVEFVPASDLLTDLRMVKDQDELAAMREAQRVTDEAFAAMQTAVSVMPLAILASVFPVQGARIRASNRMAGPSGSASTTV